MNCRLLSFSFLLFIFISCANERQDKSTTPISENDLDAARNFIRAALDGNYETGKSLLVKDSANFQFFAEYEKMHAKLKQDEQEKFKQASINVHALYPVNDTTTILIFSNSYKKNHDTLKLLKQKEGWLIDLKYLFNHDSDTIKIFKN